MSLHMLSSFLFTSDSSFKFNGRLSLSCCYLMADTFPPTGGRDFEGANEIPFMKGSIRCIITLFHYGNTFFLIWLKCIRRLQSSNRKCDSTGGPVYNMIKNLSGLVHQM